MSPEQFKSLIRIGRVVAVDGKAKRARVQWGVDESATTDWIRWTTERAGKVKTWNPPTIGEEVEVISPNGDMRNAYIGRSFYNDDNPAPSDDIEKVVSTFSDGTRIEHDRSSGTKTLTGLATLNETIGETTHTGNTTHDGDTTHTGTLDNSGELKQGGAAAFTGGITGAEGKSIDIDHRHHYDGGVTGGVTGS